MQLNMPENAKDFSDPEGVFNMTHHLRYLKGFWMWLGYQICQGCEYVVNSHNNVTLVTNVILDFLSGWFVHPGNPQIIILSFFSKSEKVRITKAMGHP